MNYNGFKYDEKNLMPPTKRQKMTRKVARFSSDEERAVRKSSKSQYGKVLKPV